MRIPAIITTLDNLPMLERQIEVLSADPLISEIVVVNNGSEDGTEAWLAGRPEITAIHRENRGAGPGRNAGLDAAWPFDYVLMLDGGILPLHGGTARMLEWLQAHDEADVVGIEVNSFSTDTNAYDRRWPDPIDDKLMYRHWRLSLTAYVLCRRRAWDGFRFREDGPFGEPGWGADDDEMAAQWRHGKIAVYAVEGAVRPYRRASGSFARLYRETGVWPNQYGSVYEQRVVWLQQNWPQYEEYMQWGEPWLTVVIPTVPEAPRMIKRAHDLLRRRRFEKPYQWVPNPYSVILWGDDPEILAWAEPRRLRHHHGDAIILDGQIVRRNAANEADWTGDFRVWRGEDWRAAIRPDAVYYGLARDMAELEALIAEYNRRWPPKPNRDVYPGARQEEIVPQEVLVCF